MPNVHLTDALATWGDHVQSGRRADPAARSALISLCARMGRSR